MSLEEHLDELRALLDRHARPDLTTAIEGVLISKVDRTDPPAPSMSGTVLAVIAQGAKRLALGDQVYEYGPGQYLVASVDLPVTGQFTRADADQPALGFGLVLEPSAVAELLLEAGPGEAPRSGGGTPSGIAVSDAPPALLDAVIRLLRLLDEPRDRAVLAPLVKREILWRLVTGGQGATVRHFGLADSSLSHISRAVRWIREHYAEPFRVEDVARRSGMSVSAFYRNFQAVTAMSPIQFQKQIRLQEARLLLATHPGDVSGVGQRVGYDNPSQFSREYRRQFGAAPSRDAAHLRSTVRTAPGPRPALSRVGHTGGSCKGQRGSVYGFRRSQRFTGINGSPAEQEDAYPDTLTPQGHSMSKKSETALFAREFLRSPLRTASLIPSSAHLAERLAAAVPERGEPVVVELGPGTGPATEAIQRKLAGRGRHIAVELNQRLATHLVQRFPRTETVIGSAWDLPGILADRGVRTADVVVSSLPWSAFTGPRGRTLIPKISSLLSESGVYTQFAYTFAHWAPPSRDRLAQLRQEFEEVVAGRTVYRNLPPALVYSARRPREPGDQSLSPGVCARKPVTSRGEAPRSVRTGLE